MKQVVAIVKLTFEVDDNYEVTGHEWCDADFDSVSLQSPDAIVVGALADWATLAVEDSNEMPRL